MEVDLLAALSLPDAQEDEPRTPLHRIEGHDAGASARGASQTRRRELALQRQRAARSAATAARRPVLVASAVADGATTPSQGSTGQGAGASQAGPGHGAKTDWAAQLMLSEDLVQVPADLATRWIAVECPVGRRVLLTASNGVTVLRSKRGRVLKRFPSRLPGGSRRQGSAARDACVMDAVWCETEGRILILDVMLYRCMDFYDAEAEARFAFLLSNVVDSGCTVPAPDNPYAIQACPRWPCTLDNLAMFAASASPATGLALYHAETHYTPGITPLVCYLPRDRLPILLDLPVSQQVLTPQDAPATGLAPPRNPKSETRRRDQAAAAAAAAAAPTAMTD